MSHLLYERVFMVQIPYEFPMLVVYSFWNKRTFADYSCQSMVWKANIQLIELSA